MSATASSTSDNPLAPWVEICWASGCGGGTFACLVALYGLGHTVLTSPWPSNPIVVAVASVQMLWASLWGGVGIIAVGFITCLCLAVILMPVGVLVSWTFGATRPLIIPGVVYSGAMVGATTVILGAVLAGDGAQLRPSIDAVIVSSIPVGQLAGFWGRSLASRRRACTSREHLLSRTFRLSQIVAATTWLAVLFTLISLSRLDKGSIATPLAVAVLLTPFTAVLALRLGLAFPLAPEKAWRRIGPLVRKLPAWHGIHVASEK